MLDRIVIATHNPAKRERYARLLGRFAGQVLSLNEVGITEKSAELGETAEDNALLKARFYCSRVQLPVLSEDEALYVDFLSDDEQPGVHVRRVDRQDEVDDDALLAHWEQRIREVPAERRTGRWHFAFAIVFPDGRSSVASIDRRIRFFSPSSKMRIPGWPMSSLQGPLDAGKPHSEMTEDEKRQAESQIDSMVGEALTPFFLFT